MKERDNELLFSLLVLSLEWCSFTRTIIVCLIPCTQFSRYRFDRDERISCWKMMCMLCVTPILFHSTYFRGEREGGGNTCLSGGKSNSTKRRMSCARVKSMCLSSHPQKLLKSSKMYRDRHEIQTEKEKEKLSSWREDNFSWLAVIPTTPVIAFTRKEWRQFFETRRKPTTENERNVLHETNGDRIWSQMTWTMYRKHFKEGRMNEFMDDEVLLRGKELLKEQENYQLRERHVLRLFTHQETLHFLPGVVVFWLQSTQLYSGKVFVQRVECDVKEWWKGDDD